MGFAGTFISSAFYTLAPRPSTSELFSSGSNLISQITRIGFSLFTYSAVDIFTDIYILLGYFGLAVILFLHRSDDWMAVFLSIMIMTFGVRVTNIGNEIAAQVTYQFWVSPILMMGEAGIVLLGWLYPDGAFPAALVQSTFCRYFFSAWHCFTGPPLRCIDKRSVWRCRWASPCSGILAPMP